MKTMSDAIYQCSECKKEVFSETEQDMLICNYCADRMYERELERKEWRHYHNEI